MYTSVKTASPKSLPAVIGPSSPKSRSEPRTPAPSKPRMPPITVRRRGSLSTVAFSISRCPDECLWSPDFPISSCVGPGDGPCSTSSMIVSLRTAVKHPIKLTEPPLAVANWRSMVSEDGFHYDRLASNSSSHAPPLWLPLITPRQPVPPVMIPLTCRRYPERPASYRLLRYATGSHAHAPYLPS